MNQLAKGLFSITLLLMAGCATRPEAPSPPVETLSPAAQATPATPPSPTPQAAASPAQERSPVAAAPANAPTTEASETTPSNTHSDTVIIPGERVGSVTTSTTHQDLVAQYGEANLKDEAVPLGEGETAQGTVVNPGRETTFTVVWSDDTRTRPDTVTQFGSAWQTPEGIKVGTSFQELEEKLGTFKLYGFGWDYGGTVVLEGSNLAQYDGVLILRVQPAENALETASKEYEAVLGDGLFPASDPNFQPLGIKVYEMIVSLSAKG